MSDGDTLYWKRLSKRIQLTFESHFCEYDVCDFSVTFRFCSFLANFSRIWFCISSRLVLPIIYETKPYALPFSGQNVLGLATELTHINYENKRP